MADPGSPLHVFRFGEDNRMYVHGEEVVLARDVERLREALWECVKLSGADTSDGPPRPGTGDWPHLPELAVREVAQLRQDYESACDELFE